MSADGASDLRVHPFEELIEERDGERGVTMRRAVDDPLGDQCGAAWRDRFHSNAERCRDVPGAVWSRTQRCHGDEVLAFPRRETVEADEEEVLVKLVLNSWSCTVDVIRGDRALRGGAPDVVAPFLEEVRVAVGAFDHDVQRAVLDGRATLLSRDLERRPSVLDAE